MREGEMVLVRGRMSGTPGVLVAPPTALITGPSWEAPMTAQNPSAPRYLTASGAAELLGVTETEVLDLIAAGRLRAMNAARRVFAAPVYRLRPDWVESYRSGEPLEPLPARDPLFIAKAEIRTADELRRGRLPVLTDRRQGLYFLWKGERIVYVGQARGAGGALSRIGAHAAVGKEFDAYTFLPVRGDLDVIENLYIQKLNPCLNRQRRDLSINAAGQICIGKRRAG